MRRRRPARRVKEDWRALDEPLTVCTGIRGAVLLMGKEGKGRGAVRDRRVVARRARSDIFAYFGYGIDLTVGFSHGFSVRRWIGTCMNAKV